MEDTKGKVYAILGNCYKSLGQYEEAIKCLTNSLNVARGSETVGNEGAIYHSLGACYAYLSQYNKAIEYHKISLIIAKEIGNKDEEGRAYGNLGACYGFLGQYNKAIEYHKISLIIAKEIGNKDEEGRAYGNLGACYGVLGQYDKAIEHHKISLAIVREIGNKEGECIAFCSLGAWYVYLGQYNKAIKYLELALTLAKQNGHKKYEGAVYGNLGGWYSTLGQYKNAKRYFERSLSITKEIEDKKGQGEAHGNIGRCYISLKQHQKAIRHLEMSLSITKEIGDKKGEGQAHGNIGMCYVSLEQYQKAIMHLETHCFIANEIGDRKAEGTANGALGACYISLTQYDKAFWHFKMQLYIAKEIRNKKDERSAYCNLGGVYFCLRQYDDAEHNFRKAMECCETLYDNVPMIDEYKISFINSFIFTQPLLIQTLMVQRKTNEALVIAEKGRSRALTSLITNTDLIRYTANTEANVLDIGKIRRAVKAMESTVIFFTRMPIRGICTWTLQPNGDIISKEHCSEVSRDNLSSLVNKTMELMTSCGAVRCEDRSLTFLHPKDLSNQTAKKAETLLVYGAPFIDLTVPHPADGQKNEEKQELARTTASVSPEDIEASTAHESKRAMLDCLLKYLYHILLEPVRQHVMGSQAIVVPDGPLSLVPFAALVDENGNYLSESLQVRLIPSLKVAKLIRERPVDLLGQGRPLIVGDPDVDQVIMDGKIVPVPKLEWVGTELQMIAQWLGAKQLVGKRATKQKFLKKAENASLIHIAAHGDAQRGEILLAPNPGLNRIPNREDIMLTITDLERKRIKAKLVVLSCCHSGRGDVSAEGVIGIGRAFLGAGARAVLVTLWSVDDGATLCFMHYFYQHLIDGVSANEALNRSMKTIREMENFRHPRYWAPFVLLGEDVTFTGLKKMSLAPSNLG